MAFGFARSDSFMISTATLMFGPLGQLKNLNPSDHSIGLVKNLSIAQETTMTELTQGISNDVVASLITGNQISCSGEVYEYTASNLAYGLGLDGARANFTAAAAMHTPKTNIAAAATTVVIETDVTTQYPVGSWIFIQDGQSDKIHIARVSVSAFASGDTTLTITGYAVPTGVTFPAASSRIGRVNKIDANVSTASTNFACKIVGRLADAAATPITVLMPKVKITRGFNLAFNSDNFGNLPFEFTPYVPVSTDVGYDANFASRLHVFL